MGLSSLLGKLGYKCWKGVLTVSDAATCSVVNEFFLERLGLLVLPIYIVAVTARITSSSSPRSANSSTRPKHDAAIETLLPLALRSLSPYNRAINPSR